MDVISQLCQEKKNDLGLLLGAEFIPRTTTASNQNLSFSRSIAFSIAYARRLFSGHTALFLEIPFAAGPSYKVDSTQHKAITSLAALFVTPFLRACLAGHAPVSPWLSGGFGYGLYEGSRTFQDAIVSTQVHRNVATAQFGGGIDVRTPLRLPLPISLRGKVRDYYTLETPNFGVPVQRSEQHNVVLSAGFVVRF